MSDDIPTVTKPICPEIDQLPSSGLLRKNMRVDYFLDCTISLDSVLYTTILEQGNE